VLRMITRRVRAQWERELTLTEALGLVWLALPAGLGLLVVGLVPRLTAQ